MEKFTQNNIKRIYDKLGDDLSKSIFSNRLMYSLTNDSSYLLNIILQTPEGKLLKEKLQTTGKKAIFGASTLGKEIFQLNEAQEWVCFIDNKYKDGSEMYGNLPILNMKTFLEWGGTKLVDAIVVASFWRSKEMIDELKSVGIQDENIIDAGGMMERMGWRQYFDLPQLKDRIFEEEVFIDGGCFDGNSSLAFEKWLDGRKGKIYAFEPDENNVLKVKKCLSASKCSIEIIAKGLWSGTTEVKFDQRGTAGSKIADDGEVQVPVTSIDDTVNEKVTFIKMDIEGSEYVALLGAKRVITENKPRLAICVYHKPEDIVELPLLILSMNSEYTFYLRHYSIEPGETVLYAI